MVYSTQDVVTTAEIDRIHRGNGIVDFQGQTANVGQISRSDIGREVKIISAGQKMFCVRPAHVGEINRHGHAIINTRDGHINLGPISPELEHKKVEILQHGNSSAYCTDLGAIDDIYPYYMFPDVPSPVNNPWYPISTSTPDLKFKIVEVGEKEVRARAGEITQLTVSYDQSIADFESTVGDEVRIELNLRDLPRFPYRVQTGVVNDVSLISSDSDGATGREQQTSNETTAISPQASNSEGSTQEAAGSEGKTVQNINTSSGDVDDGTNLTEEEVERIETTKTPRSASFREAVREAYEYTCAICGSQRYTPKGTPEVEAAHIYPKSEGGGDDVRNGLALCKLHHWAFDNGWLSVTDDYCILVRDAPDTGGYEQFAPLEGNPLHLPDDEQSHPHPVFLEAHRELHGFN